MDWLIHVLRDDASRAKAIRWIMGAKPGTRVGFKPPSRTLDQNALMWSLLTQIGEQIPYYGKHRTPDAWKDLFTAALKDELEIIPGLNGGFVVLGMSTSKMGKEEFSNLIELIFAYGAEHGVHFRETKEAAHQIMRQAA